MIRNAGLKHIHVEDTNEGITTLDVVIEIPDRRLGFVGLDQDHNLTQINGQQILVDPMVAVGIASLTLCRTSARSGSWLGPAFTSASRRRKGRKRSSFGTVLRCGPAPAGSAFEQND